MKEEYANNLGDDDHLIAVQDRANQSKGARGPDEWMPLDKPTGASTRRTGRR